MNATDQEPFGNEDDPCTPSVFEWITEGVLIFVIGNIGLLGNCISIWTFSRQRVHRIFHNLLLVLAIFDIIYVVCSIHLFAMSKFWPAYDQMAKVPSQPIVIPIAHISLMGSVYCTVALALERFLAVCYPFLPRRHVYSTKSFVIPVILFSCLYNVPKFFELKVGYAKPEKECDYLLLQSPNDSLLALQPTDLRIDPLYIRIYILWMNFFFHIVGPFVILIILNYKVHARIKEYERTLTDTLRVCFNRSTSQRQSTVDRSLHGNDNRNDEDQDAQSEFRKHPTNRRSFFPSHRINNSRTEGLLNSMRKHRQNSHSNVLEETTSFINEPNGSGSGTNNASSGDPNEIRRANLRYWEEDGNNDAAMRRAQRQQSKLNAWSTPRKREVLLSRISIYIVFIFVVCHSVRLIPNTYEVIHTYTSTDSVNEMPWPTWVARVTNLSHVLLTLVCSLNFYIYYFKHGSLCQRKTTIKLKTRVGSEVGKRSQTTLTEAGAVSRNPRTSFQSNRVWSNRSGRGSSSFHLGDTIV